MQTQDQEQKEMTPMVKDGNNDKAHMDTKDCEASRSNQSPKRNEQPEWITHKTVIPTSKVKK